MTIMPIMDGGGQPLGLQRCRLHEPLSRWRYLMRDMTLLHLHFLRREISTISLLAVTRDGLGETILKGEILERRESLPCQCPTFRRAGVKTWWIDRGTGQSSADERARTQLSGRQWTRAGGSTLHGIRMRDTTVSQDRDRVP